LNVEGIEEKYKIIDKIYFERIMNVRYKKSV
jgi:hypothetical protein